MNMSGLIDTEQNEWKQKIKVVSQGEYYLSASFSVCFPSKNYIHRHRHRHRHRHTHTHYYKFWCELILEVLYLPRLLEFIGIPNHAC